MSGKSLRGLHRDRICRVLFRRSTRLEERKRCSEENERIKSHGVPAARRRGDRGCDASGCRGLRREPAGWGRGLVFFIFMLGLMFPFFSVVIPLFYELRDIGLLGTKAGVVLVLIAGGFGVPIGVFLMRSLYMDLPEELADAARVDGATEFQVFRSIMLQLSGPGVAVLAVLVFFLERLCGAAAFPSRIGESGARYRPLPVRERSNAGVRRHSSGEPDHGRPRRGLLPDLPAAVHQGPDRRRA